MKSRIGKSSLSSLRVRLMILVLIIAFPITGIIVYRGNENIDQKHLSVLNETQNYARNASLVYSQIIAEARLTLYHLSLLPQFQKPDQEACSQIFTAFLEENKSLTGLALIKANGDVCASVPALSEPLNFADRPWFQRLVQTRDFVIGKYSIGRLSGKPVIVMGYPVLDRTGRLVSILSAGLDLERLQKTLANIKLPEGANLNVIDSNGTVIFRFPDPEKLVGRGMPEHPIVKAILTRKEGVQEGIGLDKARRLYGFTTIGSGIEAIHITVSIPEKVAFAGIRRENARNFALMGSVFVLALLGAWLFGRISIMSPVQRLIDFTKRVAEGDLTARTGQTDVGGEFGLLAYNFDQMAESLQQREDERKLTEEALRENEEKYRLHFENVSDVIFSLDRDFRILSISPSLERVLGYRPEEFIGKPFPELNILPPEYLKKAFSETMRVFGGEVVLSSIYEFIASDGTRKFGEVSGTPVLREGQVEAVVAVARDITEHKKAEDKLRLTQFSVNCAAEPVAWLGKDGRYLYVNDTYCHLLNYSRDELLSLSVFNIDPNFSAEDWPERWEKRKREGSSVFETSFRTKDGVLTPVEIHAEYLAYEDKEFIVSFTRDIRERKRHEEQLKRRLRQLTALREIDMAITASLDLRVTLAVFLDQVTSTLGVDAADVLLFDLHNHMLTFAAGRGFLTRALQHTKLPVGKGFAGRVVRDRRMICIPDLQKEAGDTFRKSPFFPEENFVAYHGAPLIAKGHVKGVLEIFNRTPLAPDQEWLDFIDALATQAAIAVDNASLFDDLQKSNTDLTLAYDATLEGWSRALDLRDKETEGHSRRVTELTVQIARKMGFRNDGLTQVRRGALLHDIGKMGIPDSILLKPGPLNDEEWEIMRKHPTYAYEFLSPIPYLRPALDIPYNHHEKWNGTGYPRGLKGEQIPLAARIFAIVDVWDALHSERPYRPAWPKEKIIEYIREESGKHFDPKVVEVFLSLMNTIELV